MLPHTTPHNGSEDAEHSGGPPPSKKRKRGQNKHRPRPARISFSEMLCPSLHDLQTPDVDSVLCLFKEKCRYTHDIAKFMAEKDPDIGEKCYMFEKLGKCPYGAACRFASSHVTSEFVNVVKEGVYDSSRPVETLNLISRGLQENLRKRRLAFVRSERYLERLQAVRDLAGGSSGNVPAPPGQGATQGGGSETEGAVAVMEEGTGEGEGNVGDPPSKVSPLSGAVTDLGEIRLRPAEKKKVCY